MCRQLLRLLLALTMCACIASALRAPLATPCIPLRASSPVSRASRASSVTCGERDDFVLYGDCAVLLGFGFIQAAVDVSFAPMKSVWSPELFDVLVGEPVMLPTIQITVLTAFWVATGMALGGSAVDPYDIKRSRGVTPLSAVTAALAPWVATFVLASVLLLFLDASFQIGPGLSEEEANFLVGTFVVVAGWRLVANALLPPI